MKLKYYIIALVCSMPIVNGCETPNGFPGVSDDIKDSKERGVFIKEYTVYPNPFKINDTLQIAISEAWLEKQWRHTSTKKGARLEKNGYQIAINSNDKDLKGVDFDWSIGISENKYLHLSSKNSLTGDLKEMPGDTIDFRVQKGQITNDTSRVQIIGHFVLVKK